MPIKCSTSVTVLAEISHCKQSYSFVLHLKLILLSLNKNSNLHYGIFLKVEFIYLPWTGEVGYFISSLFPNL